MKLANEILNLCESRDVIYDLTGNVSDKKFIAALSKAILSQNTENNIFDIILQNKQEMVWDNGEDPDDSPEGAEAKLDFDDKTLAMTFGDKFKKPIEKAVEKVFNKFKIKWDKSR